MSHGLIDVTVGVNHGGVQQKKYRDGKEVKDHFNPGLYWDVSHRSSPDSLHRLAMLIDGVNHAPDRHQRALHFGHCTPTGNCNYTGQKNDRHSTRKRNEDYHMNPTAVLVLEVDSLPIPVDLREDPEGAARAAVDAIFSFHDFDWFVNLSSSAGLKPHFRGHLFVELDAHYLHDMLKDWLRDLNAALREIHGADHDIIDYNVFKPGGQVIIARPDIDDDPFPGRKRLICHYNTGYAIAPPIDSAEGMVPLTVARNHGKTPHTYQLDAGPMMAAEGGVSGEVWNYMLSCKRAGMTLEEALAALEADLKEMGVPKATWDRLRDEGKKRHLELAIRIWGDLRAGEAEQKTYGAPAFDTAAMDLTEGTQQLQHVIDFEAEQVTVTDEDKVQQYRNALFWITTGLGKTEAYIDFLLQRRFTEKIVVCVPDHDMAKELARRIQERLDEPINFRLDDPQIHIWQGRMRCCEKMERADDLAIVMKAKQDVQKFCKGCRFYEFECPYYRQFAKGIWITTTATLASGSPVFDGADLVIVDESFAHVLLGETRIKNLELLKTNRGDRLTKLGLKAFQWKVEGGPEMTPEEVEEALTLEKARKPKLELTGDMDNETLLNAVRPMEDYYPQLVSFWKGLRDELNGCANVLHFYDHDVMVENVQTTLHACRVSWRKDITSSIKCPIWCFDATPHLDGVKRVLGDDVAVHKVDVVQHARVTQVWDMKGKSTEFLPRVKEGEPGYAEDAARAKAERDWFVQCVKAQPGRTLVCTRKELALLLKEEGLTVAWYGKLQGRDRWLTEDGVELHGVNIDNIEVVGRQAPMPYQIEALARQMFYDDPKPVKVMKPKKGKLAWYKSRKRELADGRSGVELRHDDWRAQGMLDQVMLAALIQAVGRGRAVRREGRPLRLRIWHNVPIPGLKVDQVIGTGGAKCKVGDVVLLSRAHVADVIGYESDRVFQQDKTVVPTHKYWVEGGGPKGYRCMVAADVDAEAALREAGIMSTKVVAVE